MAHKPAVISFDDTEEDDFDRPQKTSSNPTLSPIVNQQSTSLHAPIPLASVGADFTTSTGSLNSPPSPEKEKEKDNRPRSASLAAKLRPQSMFVKSSPSILEDLKNSKKEEKKEKEKEKEKEREREKEKEKEKHDSGTLSKLKATIFKGKKQEPPKKIQIGTPSNFHHVAGQGGVPASVPIIYPLEEKGEPTAQAHSASIKSSKSHESVSSVATSHTNSSDTTDITADMIQSDPKAFTRLTKKKIEDLINGAYFLQHTKSANTQKFVSCSEDMSCLNFWANVYDKDAGVTPQEAYKFSDILGIKLGYSTPIFKDTGIEGRQVLAFSLVLQNKTTLDLEAFSPADKDFWVESFNGLISLVKAQSIPAPMNRPHRSNSNAGHVSAL